MTRLFIIRLANSEYPTLVCLKNMLFTSDLIYTGKLEIPSATKEILAQKYIMPRSFANYTENQVQGKGKTRNQDYHNTTRWKRQQHKNEEERWKKTSRLSNSVASLIHTSRLSTSTKICSDQAFKSKFLRAQVSVSQYLDYRQFLELSIFS